MERLCVRIRRWNGICWQMRRCKQTQRLENWTAQQRAGDTLSQDELDIFYELQELMREHPLMQDRNKKLTVAKGYLQHLSAELNQKLGLDYVTLVLS